jgi:hypothetical protein
MCHACDDTTVRELHTLSLSVSLSVSLSLSSYGHSLILQHQFQSSHLSTLCSFATTPPTSILALHYQCGMALIYADQSQTPSLSDHLFSLSVCVIDYSRCGVVLH